jgi:hypothetical protein
VLATHFSYVWLFHDGALGNIGTFTPGSANPPSPLATDVVTSSATGADFAKTVSIETPILSTPDKNCGRLIFSDFHASVTAPLGTTFPGECDPDLTLTAEEKALAFMLFDLTSCTGAKVAPPPLRPPPPPPGSPPPPPPPAPPPPPLPEMTTTLRIIERR